MNQIFFLPQRRFSTAKYFYSKVKPKNNLINFYRRRVKSLAGTLGVPMESLKDFYPKFNKHHISEELKELVPKIPESQKPVHCVKMLLRGIGFRATWFKEKDQDGVPGQFIRLRLGFTHEIQVRVPDHISIKEGDLKKNHFSWVADNISPSDCQEIHLFSKDFARLTCWADQIKRKRPPDPYKLKGIFIDTGKKRTQVKRKKAKSGRS